MKILETRVYRVLDMLFPPGMVVIFGDKVSRGWELIVGFGRSHPRAGSSGRSERVMLETTEGEPVLAGKQIR